VAVVDHGRVSYYRSVAFDHRVLICLSMAGVPLNHPVRLLGVLLALLGN